MKLNLINNNTSNLNEKPNTEAKNNSEIKALFIGIADYYDISDLKYSGDDAVKLRAALEGNPTWQNAEITSLIDKQAAKRNILTAIEKYKGKLSSNDTFFFFFSGHGTNDSKKTYLCPYDTLYFNKDTWLSETELANALKSLAISPTSPPKIIFMADSCYSGGLIGSIGNDDSKESKFFMSSESTNIIDNNLKEVSQVPNITGISASSGKEKSYESPMYKQGVFTYYLLNGLGKPLESGPADMNKDKKITVEESFSYIKPLITNHPEFPNKQHPQIIDSDPINEITLKA